MDTSQILVDRASPVRSGEELDWPQLESFLRDQLEDVDGDFAVEQFPSGHSNLTYLVRFGDRELVMRRPPFGNPVKTAHDMGREFRVLSKLCNVFPPAPRPFLFCTDPDVIGDDFYVMERRTGVVLRRDNTPPLLSEDPTMTNSLCEAFVDNLAALHCVDYRAAGLGELGRPQGYIDRQVTGWIGRYEKAKTDDLVQLEQLGQWLDGNRPPDGTPALIHNDYKYDNLLLDSGDLTKVVAVLDWEMATVGDPLMDLGMTLCYWIEKNDPALLRQLAFGPTMLEGSYSRHELVDRYANQVGIAVPDMLFYYCFGMFKLATIIQQIYARFERGLTDDARFAGWNKQVEAIGIAAVTTLAAGKL